MKNPRAARRYAAALLAEAEQHGLIDAVGADLEAISTIVRESRELRLLLSSPLVSPQRKGTVIDALLARRVNTHTLSFLHFLLGKHREGLLLDIIEQFAELRDAKQGIVTVDVRSAVSVAPPQEEELRSRLQNYTGKKVRLHMTVDPAVKGGLVVRIGDTVLDASIKRQLERLREHLAVVQPLDVQKRASAK